MYTVKHFFLKKNTTLPHLVYALRGLNLHLRRRSVDRVRDVGLQSNEQPSPVRDALAKTVVQFGVFVYEAVVASGAVQVDEGRAERGDET